MSDLVNALHDAGRSSSVLGAIANPATVNPLAAYDAAARTAGNIYNIQSAQAQRAWGDALQQSTGPDGVVDYDKARAIAAQNPLAAMGMMAGLKGASELSGQAIVQGDARNKMITDAQAAALKVPDDQLHDAVLAGTQKLVAAGALTQEQAHRALLMMPNDPAQLRAQIERNRIALLPPQQQETNLYGTVGTQTGPGGVTIGTRQAPPSEGGGVSVPEQPGAPQGLPATELDRPFTYTDPKTQRPKTSTLRQFYIDNGMQVPGAATGGAGLPTTLHNSAKPAATPAPGAAPPPKGGVDTGPSPAEIKQAEADAANSAQAFQDISSRAVASRDRSAILGNMLGDTAQFTTGPLAQITGRLRNLGIALKIPGIDVEGQTAKESFGKLAAQLAQAQSAGAPSDARQAMSVEANPHQELSPAGVNLMIRQLQGNEDYLQTRAKLAGSTDQRDIKRWENETGAKLDPRAFQFARMTPDQRQAWVKSLSAADRNRVQTSYNWLHGQGLVGD